MTRGWNLRSRRSVTGPRCSTVAPPCSPQAAATQREHLRLDRRERRARSSRLNICSLRNDPQTKRPHRGGLRLRLEHREPIAADRYLDVERLDQTTKRQFPFEHGNGQEAEARAVRRRLSHRDGESNTVPLIAGHATPA